MSEWIRCPKCGALMIEITSGHICPLCGYSVPAQTITITTGTSVEYVPVIRCKDCKHLRIVNSQELAAVCSFHCYKFEPFEDDYRECFCSWAERKEE